MSNLSKRRMQDNPQVKFRQNFGARVYAYLKKYANSSKGDSSCFDLLPYTKEELIAHIEKQFRMHLPHPIYGPMGWNNYGKWHLDHIRPISSFNITSPDDDDFLECWSLSNLQPLWAEDNLAKSDYYDPESDELLEEIVEELLDN